MQSLSNYQGFPCSSIGKESACNAGDPGSIPGSGRSLGEGNGNPLQYSCLENPMDRGAWWATVHGVAKSRTQLSDFSLLPYAQKVQTTNSSFFNWRINALQCCVSLCSTTVYISHNYAYIPSLLTASHSPLIPLL